MVRRWDIITIGNLSRNRYWDESEEVRRRPTLCTCTLITTAKLRVLVDPSADDPLQMSAELDRRSGLHPGDINMAFMTHAHGDHHFGLLNFPDATWLAAPEVAAAINASGRYGKQVEPAGERIGDAIEVFHAPGHTPDHHCLRFDCDGLSVVIAGDAVMTRDFWVDRQGYFNSVDFEQASRTIGAITEIADIIVPGHDNCFVVPRER